MMDIKTWLEEIGMGEHWEKFESNKIDEDTLKSMTENDLKDIGVDALGDRKTLIAGISKLNGESSSGNGGGGSISGALIGGVAGWLIGWAFFYYGVSRQFSDLTVLGIVIAIVLGAIVGAKIKK
jgi:hypothetical protein